MSKNNNLIESTFGGKLRVRVCALIIKDNKLLLVRQKSINHNGYTWMPPGGGVNFNETIEIALKREVKEETNLNIHEFDFFSISEYIQMPFHAIEIFYLIKNTSGVESLGYDPELNINQQILESIQWFGLEQIKNLEEKEKHSILFDINLLSELFS